MSTNFHSSHTSKFLLLPLIIFQCIMTTTILAQAPASGPTGPTNITKILEKAGQFTTLIRLMKVTQLGDQINRGGPTSLVGVTPATPWSEKIWKN
ncbi:putative FAS1 domain superfamily protein [Helianthus debilis subsp. tardiflorus]